MYFGVQYDRINNQLGIVDTKVDVIAIVGCDISLFWSTDFVMLILFVSYMFTVKDVTAAGEISL